LNFPARHLYDREGNQAELQPVAMLKVSGVATMVTNAGNASVYSCHFTLASGLRHQCANENQRGRGCEGRYDRHQGEKNAAARNRAADHHIASPVRAPTATPAALST